MSEMVERVARAMSACRDELFPKRTILDEDEFRLFARAAIAAMREPTPAMRASGQEMLEGHPDVVTSYLVWAAMMNTALEPVDDEEKRA